MYIKRQLYWDKIKPFVNSPVIKVITGMRRVGKSYFLKQIIDELKSTGIPSGNILYIDKEDIDFDFIVAYQDLNSYIKDKFLQTTGKKYLLIDEVQEISGWEKVVTSLLKKEDFDIYITGSNAHLLSSELATLISGRYIEQHIYPLSYSEYIIFRGKEFASHKTEFEMYMKYGGLPALFHIERTDETIYQYLQAIYNTILLKDIVLRYKIRNAALLEKIAKFLFDNTGNLLTSNNIAKYLKSEKIQTYPDTVQNYLNYFTRTYIARKVERYDLKGKRLLSINDKYYINDLGMRHALLGYKSGDVSQLLENVVYIELLRRGYQVNIGIQGNKEIDFVAVKNDEKIYIQVCYILESEKTVQREFAPLLAIKDNYPKYVLSMDEKIWGEDYKGIKRINVVEWLLN